MIIMIIIGILILCILICLCLISVDCSVCGNSFPLIDYFYCCIPKIVKFPTCKKCYLNNLNKHRR